MNSAGVISQARPEQEVVSCRQCGSTSRVGRGLCLNCLLYRGLGEDTYDSETLESVLDEIDVRDADWRLGNYQILEEVGRGGMGVIYRARQRHSRRIVALKRILAHHADSHDTLVRFRREAEAAASLDHPNILPIYEVSEGEDGLPFFSMKFAAGGSLLQNQAALRSDTRRAIGLMAKVSRAVEYAHSRGILHRDLKPGNILLDGRGEPLVSDFGLAKWLDASSDLTRTLTIFGTPGYIAPEQAHGPAAGLKPTADIYSLGAILFDLIAGRPPFLGEHALSVIEQAREKPAPKLRTIVPKVDRDLETICTRCLERDPYARYHSAGDLANDLESWLEGRPIVARPVSPATRTWRWAKRSPKLATSVAGCVLGGLTILAFATLIFTRGGFGTSGTLVEKGIAVLPFQNLSDDKQNAYFTDGVQDEILNGLSKVADLKVISRTSVMQYATSKPRNLREIAITLGVAHIVEGSVQRVGDRVRVSAQLIDARNDVHLWAEHYDRDLADIFAIESELAQQIVAKLKATLSPEEKTAIDERPTKDLFAFELYIRAKELIDGVILKAQAKEDLLEAVRLLEQATARDPSFVRAYYHLARANDSAYFNGSDHTPERLNKAEQAVQALLRIRPNSGEAHLALAQHYYWGYRDYDRARQELAIAQRSLPNEPLVYLIAAYVDRRQGRWDQSINEFKRAAELDPQNVSMLKQLSLTYQDMRRFKEAVEALDRVLKITPDDIALQINRAAICWEMGEDVRPTYAFIQSALLKQPSIAESISDQWLYLALYERDGAGAQRALSYLPADGCRREGIPFPRDWCEGFVAHFRKDDPAAHEAFTRARLKIEETLRAQPDYAQGLCALGVIDAALGNKKTALEEGRRALELCPLSKDAVGGAILVEYLALIYTWTGEKELALEQLETSARIPAGIGYVELKLSPYWDSLRGDPRFEKIVASLAPRAAKK